MGCWPSKPTRGDKAKPPKQTGFKRPEWKSDEPWDEKKLRSKREEFWDTQPAYGGAREIWDTLKAVVEDLDNPNNTMILESAGITLPGSRDLRVAYDERGAKYDLPNYVLSEPTNLIRGKEAQPEEPLQGQTPAQVELVTPSS